MRRASCSCLHGSSEETQRLRRIVRAMQLCRRVGRPGTASWVWSPYGHLVVYGVFELRNRVRVVGKDISPLFGGNVQRWTGRGFEDRKRDVWGKRVDLG